MYPSRSLKHFVFGKYTYLEIDTYSQSQSERERVNDVLISVHTARMRRWEDCYGILAEAGGEKGAQKGLRGGCLIKYSLE